MTFLQTLIAEVEDSYTGTTPLYFGKADAPGDDYIVMLPILPNSETPMLLCEEMGDAGNVSVQWSLATRESVQSAYNDMEEVKVIVQAIRGQIGTSPDLYNVDANRTGGVVPMEASLGSWSAIFESAFEWSKA